jgi:N-acetylneuraminic acid mutarotase
MNLKSIFIGLFTFLIGFSLTGQNTWQKMNNFPGGARALGASFTINGKVYVTCGANGNTYKNDLWEYDPINDSWTQKASLPGSGRTEVFGFAIDTLGYVGNGLAQSGGADNKVYSYNPKTNVWTAVANTPFTNGLRMAGTFTIGNFGYIFGGLPTGSGHSNSLYKYDPVANSWTFVANAPTGNNGKTYSRCAVLNGKAYIIGGYDGATYSKNLYEFDPNTSSITLLSTTYPGSVFIAPSVFILNHRLYVGGGVSKTQSLTAWYEFNTCNNTWKSVSSFPISNSFGSMTFTLNNEGYVVGGGTVGNVVTDNVHKYSPADIYNYSNEEVKDYSIFKRPIILTGNKCCGDSIKIDIEQLVNSSVGADSNLIELSNSQGEFTSGTTEFKMSSNFCGISQYKIAINNSFAPSTKYKIRVKNSGYAGYSSASADFGIYNPMPNLGPDASIAYDDSTTLIAGAYDSYLWSNGVAVDSVKFSNKNLSVGSNLIWVRVTEKGCVARDSINIVLMKSLSSESMENNIFGIRPNPVNDILSINIDDKSVGTDFNVRLYDITGKQLIIDYANNLQINTSKLKSGTYVLRVDYNGKTGTTRFIKN